MYVCMCIIKYFYFIASNYGTDIDVHIFPAIFIPASK